MPYVNIAELRTAFAAGYAAYAKKTTCQYAENSQMAFAWRHGWTQAELDLLEQSAEQKRN